MNISLSAFANRNSVVNKTIAIALAVTTVLWLTGVATLVPLLTANAQTVAVNDGDLIRANNDFKVWIVKKVGDKKFKRHLFGPQIFDAYGHLNFDVVKVVEPSVVDEYTTAYLIRQDGDTKVYKLEDIVAGVSATKRWVETLEAFNENNFDWDGVYIINSVEMALYTAGANITSSVGSEGQVAISLAADSPASGNVALGSFDNVMTKLKFTAGDSGYIINSIAIKRNALSEDNDVNNVKIWDGSTQLGSTQALNTDTHKATFTGLNWAVPANGSKTLTVSASVNTTGNSGTAGNILSFVLAAASDISTTTTVTFGGTFPISGNEFTIAGISVGQLDVDVQTTPAATNVPSGSTDQEMAKFKFTASSTEGFDVNKIVLTEVGTSVSTDVKNVKLKILGQQIGSTSAELGAGEKVTFTGSPLFSVKAGTNKDVSVYADIADNVTSQRTVAFEITEDADVIAFGQNSKGSVQITRSSGTAYTAQTGANMTIVQGTVTITYDATNPSAQSYVKGFSQATIAIFKFSAGSREGIKVTKLKLTEGGTGTNTDYQNAKLYVDGSADSTGHTASIGTTTATFEDGNGLFDVPKSGNVTVAVKVDVPTGATTSRVLEWYLAAVTDIKAKGLSSLGEITQNSTNFGITAVDTSAEATDHTISAFGTLTVSAAPDTPSARTFASGATGLEVLKVRLASTDEDMIVSSLTVDFWENDSGGGHTNAIESGDLTNAKLYDGATLLYEVAGPSGNASFNINLTVPKDTSKTLTVTVDVPTSHDLTTDFRATVGLPTGIAADVTTTGGSSTADITETGSANANLMTLGTPSVNVAALGTPVKHSVVTSTTGHTVGSLSFTAGTSENIKITQIKVSVDDATSLDGGETASDTNFSNIKLFNGATQVGATKQLTNGTPDTATFSGLNLTVTKGQSVQIDIKADATGSTTGTFWYWGIKASTDLVGAGVSSNTAATFYEGDGTTFTTQASAGVDVIAGGTLSIAVDADTPTASNVAVGSTGKTGISLAKVKFEATEEDIRIKTLKFTRSGGIDADIAAVYLYDGATKIIGPAFIEPVNNTVTFNIFEDPSADLIIPAGGSKVVTLKVDYNGATNGTDSADAPKFYIVTLATDVVEEGISSGSTSLTQTSVAPVVTNAANFNAFTLYKSVPTVTLATDSPSGSGSATSAQTVLKFDVKADSQGDVVFNTVAFKVDGTVDTTGGSNANLYKSTDLSNALATETYKAVTLASANGQTTTVISSAVAGAFDAIPVGSNIRVWDSSGTPAYMTPTVYITAVDETGAASRITVNSALSATPATNDIVYYRPMQPGDGKLYFGGMTTLVDNFATSSSISVTSANGFAAGDSVKVSGFTNATCTLVTTSAGTLKAADTTVTDDLLTFDAAINTPAGWIDYDRDCSLSAGASGASSTKATGNAIIYTSQAARNIEENIAAGSTKTFVLKGDTTGATANENLTVSITAITDLLWDDTIRFFVNTVTSGLPMNGGTITY